MIFVDTNYFLRFFLEDIEPQFKTVKKLFLESSKGKHRLFTSVIVVFEVYWVILGQFKKDKERTILLLQKMLGLKFIEFENLSLLLEALEIYRNASVGFIDCYNVVYAKFYGASDFKTFDKLLLKKLSKK